MADSSTTSDETSDSSATTDDTGSGSESGSSGSESGSESSSSTGTVECVAPEIACGDGCVDPQTSHAFCGATDCEMGDVGVACAPSASCTAGECIDTCDNCSFETGDFTGWTTQDLATPFYPLAVEMGGVQQVIDPWTTFTSAPTDGTYSANTGWDGDGATGMFGTIEIGQDITLDADTPANLEIDYRAAWDMVDFAMATMDRTIEVHVEPEGGGVPLQTDVVFTATAGTVEDDTGDQTAIVDLGAFAGSSVYIRIVFVVPEDFAGPAFATIDNVRVVAQ